MPKVKCGRWYGSVFPDYEIRRRETGLKAILGYESGLKKSLYSSMMPCTSWDPEESDPKIGCIGPGGIFNLEFSPDGSHLVAACEQKAVMVFDPLSRRQVHHIPHAHENCVNCIKFLDARVFASCSDDHTVALWDVRNLKRRIRLLQGHSNWVKNIEYSAADGILVTSGFDGKILGWDINGYTEEGLLPTELFKMQGLMRMRLTPDCSKLIMCTTGGYMVLVHNLSLEHLSQDLLDFKPNMYRLMQLSNTPLPQAAMFTKLFYAQRNRVEFISDFPHNNDAEVIHSLQVHPQGWCVLSRNTSMDDSSEWSCVHDIQELGVTACKDDDEEYEDKHEDLDSYDDIPSTSESEVQSSFTQTQSMNASNSNSNMNSNNEIGSVNGNLHLSLTFGPRVAIRLRQSSRDDPDESGGMDSGGEGENSGAGSSSGSGSSSSGSTSSASGSRSSGNGNANVGLVDGTGIVVGEARGSGGGIDIQFRFTSMDVFEALEHIRERRAQQRRQSRQRRPTQQHSAQEENENSQGNNSGEGSSSSSSNVQNLSRNMTFSVRNRRERDSPRENAVSGRTSGNVIDSRNAFYIRPGSGNHRAILLLRSGQNYPRYLRTVDPNHKIAKNIPRLTHYIQEPNVGPGFIKELCFNSDGRLICSPFAHGVRLMMFDQNCSELSTCVQDNPQILYDVSTSKCHANCVLSTKFSPTHCLLVSGCRNGKIVWHQPVL